MIPNVFDKTDKGREEIATRKYQLSPRLRSLLVMVDGKQSIDELLRKVGGLGLSRESLADLERDGFIQAAASAAPVQIPEPQQTVAVADEKTDQSSLPVGASQFEAVYHFYNETIRSTIGLRGYALQLKVEKAASIEDFRELRQPYLEAVFKAKGNEMARSLRARLDQLLGSEGGVSSDRNTSDKRGSTAR